MVPYLKKTIHETTPIGRTQTLVFSILVDRPTWLPIANSAARAFRYQQRGWLFPFALCGRHLLLLPHGRTAAA